MSRKKSKFLATTKASSDVSEVSKAPSIDSATSRFVRAINDVAEIHSPDLAHLTAVMGQYKNLTAGPKLPQVRALDLFGAETSMTRLTNEIDRGRIAQLAIAKPIAGLSTIFDQVSRDSKWNDQAIRAALGPLHDLRLAGALDNLFPMISATNALKGALSTYESQFKLPQIAELNRLIEQPRWLSEIAKHTQLADSIARMRSPWLDMHSPGNSFNAFAQLQSMGLSLTQAPPFSKNTTGAFRDALGDWRDRIIWPDAVTGNLGARTAFYIERGYHAELTDFPTAAFEESLDVSGLTGSPPDLVAIYGEPFPANGEDDGAAFERTNKAHRWLMGFETNLRRFIDVQLTKAFGADWPRHRLPNGMYDAWLEKKRKAEAAGAAGRPLICYADFTDYEKIVCRRDVFPFFLRFFRTTENIRESLQRLYLPRIEAMHARPISQDDELLLYAELKRISVAIKRSRESTD